MNNNNESAGTNTVLIVIILVLLVGFGVWWMSTQQGGRAEQVDRNDAGLDINIEGSMTPGGDQPQAQPQQ